jgi:5'-3' exonuclease
MSKKRLVLIDFQNFLFRCIGMRYSSVKSKEKINVIYGFFKNFYELSKRMEERGRYSCDFIVCNDSGYDTRYLISEEGVKNGIIEKTYKEDRRYKAQFLTEQEKAEKKDNKRQANIVKELIRYSKISQASYQGEEADDVCGTLSKKYYNDYDSIILVTSDQDYYQLINDKVSVFNPIKSLIINEKYFKEKYEISPHQWVDRGALMGDKSDTIIGVNGFGEIKSLKFIKEHQNIDNLLSYSKEVSKNKTAKIDKLYYKVAESEELLKIAYKLKKINTELEVSVDKGEPDSSLLQNQLEEMGIYFDDDFYSKLNNTKKDMGKIINSISFLKKKNEQDELF